MIPDWNAASNTLLVREVGSQVYSGNSPNSVSYYYNVPDEKQLLGKQIAANCYKRSLQWLYVYN